MGAQGLARPHPRHRRTLFVDDLAVHGSAPPGTPQAVLVLSSGHPSTGGAGALLSVGLWLRSGVRMRNVAKAEPDAEATELGPHLKNTHFTVLSSEVYVFTAGQ